MAEIKNRKAEKRKIRKDKKRKEYIKKLEEEKIKFKIFQILKEADFSSKPNLVKFLQTYVQAIRCLTDRNFQFYPSFSYFITRIFVNFIDGHKLIFYMLSDGKVMPRFELVYNYTDVFINNENIQILNEFIESLFKFKIVKTTGDQEFSLENKYDEDEHILNEYENNETIQKDVS